MPARRVRANDGGCYVRLYSDVSGWCKGSRYPNMGKDTAPQVARMLGGEIQGPGGPYGIGTVWACGCGRILGRILQ